MNKGQFETVGLRRALRQTHSRFKKVGEHYIEEWLESTVLVDGEKYRVVGFVPEEILLKLIIRKLDDRGREYGRRFVVQFSAVIKAD